MQPNQQMQQQPTPKDFFEQAKQLLAVGDVYEASKRAGKLRSHFPEEPPILAIHGFALAKLGVHDQAIHDMRLSAGLTLRALDEGEEENPARPRIVDQYLHLQSEIGRSLTALGTVRGRTGNEHAIHFDDPDIGIEWPISNPILSDKDRAAPLLRDAPVLPVFGE